MDGHYKEYMITLIRYGIVLVLVLMTNIHEWSFLGVWFHFSFSFTHTHMTISFLPWCFMFIFLTWGKHFLVLSSFMTYHQVTILTRRVPLVEQKLLTLPVHLWSPPVFSGVREKNKQDYTDLTSAQRSNIPSGQTCCRPMHSSWTSCTNEKSFNPVRKVTLVQRRLTVVSDVGLTSNANVGQSSFCSSGRR
jgi:hypothetical protein